MSTAWGLAVQGDDGSGGEVGAVGAVGDERPELALAIAAGDQADLGEHGTLAVMGTAERDRLVGQHGIAGGGRRRVDRVAGGDHHPGLGEEGTAQRARIDRTLLASFRVWSMRGIRPDLTRPWTPSVLGHCASPGS
jgi:hypothetical protein